MTGGTVARMTTREEGARDPFEEQYMQGSGVERRRERTIWKWHWALLVPALWTFVGMVLTLAASLPGASLPVGAGLGVVSAFFALLWAALLVLRVVVTDREVHVQYGLWGPKIDLAAITDCKVIDYDWTAFGGWGIKRSAEGTWAYTLMGEGRRVVEITWKESGEVKRAVVSSRTPDELAASINQARGASGSDASSTGVRVDSTEGEITEGEELIRSSEVASQRRAGE